MTAVSQIGFVLYTPAFSAISVSLRLSSNEVQLTLTSYLLAFGLAQLVYGLLSDCWGRKKLLIIGVGVFSVGCLCAFVATGYRSFSFSERLASPPFLVWVGYLFRRCCLLYRRTIEPPLCQIMRHCLCDKVGLGTHSHLRVCYVGFLYPNPPG